LEGSLRTNDFGMVMIFGWSNCCLIPLALKIDEKPLKVNLLIGGSFFVTLFLAAMLAFFGFFVSGVEVPASGLGDVPEFAFVSALPYAPFIEWLVGGFGLVWLVARRNFKKQDSVIKKRKLDRQLGLFGAPRQQTRKKIIHQKPESMTTRKKPMQQPQSREERWDFTWDRKDETVKKIKSKQLPVSKPTFYVKDAPVICNICKGPIKNNEEITSCPACNTRFHLRHFAEWVRQKGKCPYCNEKIGIK